MKLLALVHRLLALRLFTRREDVTGKLEIIKWWELRRIPFNIAVGITGIFTCMIVFVVAAISLKRFGEPLGLPNSPIFELVGIVAYGIAANVCFTFGWLTEIIVRKIWQEKAGAFAEISFSVGLLFSILLTLVPAAFFSTVLVVRILLR